MLDTLKSLPEDPAELQGLVTLLAAEVKSQALMIERLQHQLHGANRHRFGSKSESMEQLQLFQENTEIAVAAEEPLSRQNPQRLKRRTSRNANPCQIITGSQATGFICGAGLQQMRRRSEGSGRRYHRRVGICAGSLCCKPDHPAPCCLRPL